MRCDKFLASAILIFMVLTLAHISMAQNSPQDYVDAHNAVRAQVGVVPMAWNDTVAAYARDYAHKRIQDCKLEHSMGSYGENLAEGYGNLNGVDAVKMWVSEKPNYDYSSNSCVGDVCGHYTQVIWKKSVNVGCARVKCHNGWMFVICSYYPPGNIDGERPY